MPDTSEDGYYDSEARLLMVPNGIDDDLIEAIAAARFQSSPIAFGRSWDDISEGERNYSRASARHLVQVFGGEATFVKMCEDVAAGHAVKKAEER